MIACDVLPVAMFEVLNPYFVHQFFFENIDIDIRSSKYIDISIDGNFLDKNIDDKSKKMYTAFIVVCVLFLPWC